MNPALGVRAIAALMTVGLVTTGCSEDVRRDVSEDRRSAPTNAPQETHPRQPKKRKKTRPPEPRIDNHGYTRGDRARVDSAIRTLKKLGFWDELTGHLDFVIVRTRPTESRIPEDGHLADSLFTVDIGPGPDGLVCDVLIFSRALEDDVGLQRTYYEQGSLDAPPPNLRQFWAVIVGHELAHCTRKGQEGEERSTRWERRILAAMGVTRAAD